MSVMLVTQLMEMLSSAARPVTHHAVPVLILAPKAISTSASHAPTTTLSAWEKHACLSAHPAPIRMVINA